MRNKLYLLILILLSVLNAQLSTPMFANVQTESRHILSGELGIGYSSLLTPTDLGKAMGLVGANLQVGYEWQYRHLLVHTGLEVASINSINKVNDFTLSTLYPMGLTQPMTEYFAFSNFREMASLLQINIPVMLGGIFADRYYFLAGTKIGVPVFHRSSLTSDVRTTLVDPVLIGSLGEGQEVPAHDAFASAESASSAWTASIPNVQVSAEVGVVISSFFQKNKKKNTPASRGKQQPLPRFMRVGLFCDYGVTSCGKQTLDVPAVVAAPRDITLNSYLGASSRVNSLLVGIKFAAQLQLNRPKKPEVPPTYLDVTVKGYDTQKTLASVLTIQDEKTLRETRSELRNGTYHKKTKMGSFRVVASATNYLPDTLFYSVSEQEDHQRLAFNLRPTPVLHFMARDTKTHAAMAVAVQFVNVSNEQVVATVRTDSLSGQGSVRLPVGGTYRVHIQASDYFAYTATLAHIGGNEIFEMEPIIKKRAIVLHNLFFATNETTILPESEAGLQDLYDLLNENPEIRIRITGHTDNVGSDEANQILSEGRANSVRQAIIERGIESSRIEAEGKGKTMPVAPNDTEEGRAKNRRVEFVVL